LVIPQKKVISIFHQSDYVFALFVDIFYYFNEFRGDWRKNQYFLLFFI
jgi:hypothetical protein